MESHMIPVTFSQLSGFEYLWLLLFCVAAISPYIAARVNRTPVSLATVISLMLVAVLQFLHALIGSVIGSDFDPVYFGALIPAWVLDPSHIHRLLFAGWLHGGAMHVLGNILVVALIGIPLEGRLGARRWMTLYILGILGGNIAWWLTHPDSTTPALGASGACFGLLGGYMVCWPNDKVVFPLIFLIRAWPIGLIALFRLGFEIYYVYSIDAGRMGGGNVAHLAHIGGFFLCFAVARFVARGAPSSLDDDSGDPYAMGVGNLGTVPSISEESGHPWIGAEFPLDDGSERVMKCLFAEGDEPETRLAWLEELAEQSACPVCGSRIDVKTDGHARLFCTSRSSHLDWPTD
mgnify:FL=1